VNPGPLKQTQKLALQGHSIQAQKALQMAAQAEMPGRRSLELQRSLSFYASLWAGGVMKLRCLAGKTNGCPVTHKPHILSLWQWYSYFGLSQIQLRLSCLTKWLRVYVYGFMAGV
jgi:hypothetical protein